jgi:hypothetical protein
VGRIPILFASLVLQWYETIIIDVFTAMEKDCQPQNRPVEGIVGAFIGADFEPKIPRLWIVS